MRWLGFVLLASISVGCAQEAEDEWRVLDQARNAAFTDPEAALDTAWPLVQNAQRPDVREQAAYLALNLLAARLGRPEEALELYEELAADLDGPGAEGVAPAVLGGCEPRATKALALVVEARAGAAPNNRDVWVLLAEVREHAGQWDEAVEAWAQVVALRSTTSAEASLARALLRAGRFQEALDAAAALDEEADWLGPHVVGPALVGLGRTEEAVALADALVDEAALAGRQPDWAVATLYQAAGAYPQAIALLEDLIETAPYEEQRLTLRCRLAEAYAAAGDTEAEYGEYKTAANAGSALARNVLLERFVDRLLEPAEANSLLAAIFGPDLGQEAWRAGQVLASVKRAGKLPQWEAALAAALEKTPDSPTLLLLTLDVASRRRDYAVAVQVALRLHAVAPTVITPYRIAGLLANAGDYATALEWIDKAVPKHWPLEGAALVVKCCRELGRMDKLEQYAAKLHEGPAEAGCRAYAEGSLWLEAGQAERAIPLLEEARRAKWVSAQDPLLARAYLAANRPVDAMAEYEACLKGARAWTVLHQALVGLYSQHLAPEEYVPRLASVLRGHPLPREQPDTVVRVWLDQVVKPEEEARRLPALAGALEAECAAQPEDACAWAGLGLTQLALRHYDAARRSLSRAMGLDGAGLRDALTGAYAKALAGEPLETPAARWARVEEEYRTEFVPALEAGDVARAVRIACEVLDCLADGFAGKRPDFALGMANQARRANRAEEFAAAVQARLAAEEGNVPAIHLLVACHRDGRRPGDVVALLQEEESAIRGEPALWALLGNAYGELGRVAEAEEAYERLLALSPEDWPNALGLGWIYLRYQRTADAETWAERALAWAEAGQGRGHTALGAGELLLACGAGEKAARAADAVVADASADGRLLQQAAGLYRRLERWEALGEVCRKALASESRNVDRAEVEKLLQEAVAHGAPAAPGDP
ncbi:MAG: tetratricopeptide repeat protein [Armatimonadetes bacterium]|nr:tetratricopeptide repeat protein [Armatimonadota bacterium]